MTNPASSDAVLARLTEAFDALPAELRKAARYLVDHPSEVAFRSMRTVAAGARVSPATMVRLVRALGLRQYEELRSAFQARLDARAPSFLERARALRAKSRSKWNHAVHQVIDEELSSLHECVANLSDAALEKVARLFVRARRLYVVGFRGMHPAAFAFYYATSLFSDRVVLVDGPGGTFLDAVRDAGPRDVVLVFTCKPYSRPIPAMVAYARGRGMKIVSVTDSPLSPAARSADVVLMVRATTSSLPSSSTANVLLSRVLAALYLAASGSASVAAIRNTDGHLAAFDLYQND